MKCISGIFQSSRCICWLFCCNHCHSKISKKYTFRENFEKIHLSWIMKHMQCKKISLDKLHPDLNLNWCSHWHHRFPSSISPLAVDDQVTCQTHVLRAANCLNELWYLELMGDVSLANLRAHENVNIYLTAGSPDHYFDTVLQRQINLSAKNRPLTVFGGVLSYTEWGKYFGAIKS